MKLSFKGFGIKGCLLKLLAVALTIRNHPLTPPYFRRLIWDDQHSRLIVCYLRNIVDVFEHTKHSRPRLSMPEIRRHEGSTPETVTWAKVSERFIAIMAGYEMGRRVNSGVLLRRSSTTWASNPLPTLQILSWVLRRLAPWNQNFCIPEWCLPHSERRNVSIS